MRHQLRDTNHLSLTQHRRSLHGSLKLDTSSIISLGAFLPRQSALTSRAAIMKLPGGSRLDQIISAIALSLSVVVLVCLSIVFVGCTSPSAPKGLYFMKVRYKLLALHNAWGLAKHEVDRSVRLSTIRPFGLSQLSHRSQFPPTRYQRWGW